MLIGGFRFSTGSAGLSVFCFSMEDATWIADMSDSTVIILALIALVVPILNWLTVRRAVKAAEKAAERAGQASAKLDVVHGQINGMKDELIRATGAEKLAEGEVIGREKAISEKADRTAEAERIEDRVAGKQKEDS